MVQPRRFKENQQENMTSPAKEEKKPCGKCDHYHLHSPYYCGCGCRGEKKCCKKCLPNKFRANFMTMNCTDDTCPCHSTIEKKAEELHDCSGCTDDRSEGTHQSHTIQHPCKEGGDSNCGYCFPEKFLTPISSDVEKEQIKEIALRICALTGYGTALHVNDIIPDLKELLLNQKASLRKMIEGMRKECLAREALKNCIHVDCIAHNAALDAVLKELE